MIEVAEKLHTKGRFRDAVKISEDIRAILAVRFRNSLTEKIGSGTLR